MTTANGSPSRHAGGGFGVEVLAAGDEVSTPAPAIAGQGNRQEAAGQWIARPPVIVAQQRYWRYVVRTHLVRPRENLVETLTGYLRDRVGPRDVVVVGEKVVAIAEGRLVRLEDVHPGFLARTLAARVRPVGYGLGLRRPETMQVALREAGACRILAAALLGLVGRMMGRSGDFYRLAGHRVASIDGPGPTTIAPYHRYIVLAPRRAEEFCRRLAGRIGCAVAVVDANDVGNTVLAASPGVDRAWLSRCLRDNPMGQGAQRTPLVVVREDGAPAWLESWPALAAWRWGGICWVRPGEGAAGLAGIPDGFGSGED